MKLQLSPRGAEKKRDSVRLRREGNIPAVIYVQGKEAESVSIPEAEFASALRQVQPGRLPTTVFTLVGAKGKERRAIVKEIQYHPTTYNVMHLDFEELHDNVRVNVKVPIECTGIVDCVGIKLGGMLRQVIRYLRVNCLPRDLPTAIEVDIRNMGQNDSKRLSDLKIPANVRPLADLHEVALVIVKR